MSPPGSSGLRAFGCVTPRGASQEGTLNGVPVLMVCNRDFSMDNNPTSMFSHNINNI